MTMTSNTNHYCVVIPASGTGSRFGGVTPKQYTQVAGKTILEHTLDCFLQCDFVKSIVVTLHPQDQHWSTLQLTDKRIVTVTGGNTRAQSVLNALTLLSQSEHAQQWVMVHDACRPYLSVELIKRLVDAVQEDRVGGLLAIPATDTLKRVEGNRIVATIPRDQVWHAQTPQLFRLACLQDALSQALAQGQVVTDEASAIESAGLSPLVVEGDVSNIKITYAADIVN